MKEPAYTTKIADVASPSWFELRPGYQMSAPLLSTDGAVTYARLPYRDALAMARDARASLPAQADVVLLSTIARAIGREIAPAILPTVDQLKDAGIALNNETAIQALRVEHMMGISWCQVHDALVNSRVDFARKASPGTGPFANILKLWIAGASKGRARLMGWRKRDGSWWQSGNYPGKGGEFHNDQYCDYSSGTVLVRTV